MEGSSAFGSQIRKAKSSCRIIFRQYGKAHMALVEVQKPQTAAIQNRNFSSAFFAISLCLPVFAGRRQRGKLLIRLENLIAQTPPLLFVVVWIVHSFVPKREEKVMINLHETFVLSLLAVLKKSRTATSAPHQRSVRAIELQM